VVRSKDYDRCVCECPIFYSFYSRPKVRFLSFVDYTWYSAVPRARLGGGEYLWDPSCKQLHLAA